MNVAILDTVISVTITCLLKVLTAFVEAEGSEIPVEIFPIPTFPEQVRVKTECKTCKRLHIIQDTEFQPNGNLSRYPESSIGESPCEITRCVFVLEETLLLTTE